MSDTEPLRTPRLYSHDFARDEPPRRGWRPWRWLLALLLVLLLAPPAAVLALRWLPPPTTAFMLRSPVQPVDYVWVPRARHPQTLRDAVIAAEDQKFYTHHGFDFEAIEKALEHNQRSKRKRGASTISQQVAKNLFMWPSRSYLRKGLEAGFTVLIELAWPKERILEAYLNIAEFGPGTYGVEAAARKFFDKSAQDLSPTESARLAAVLPNPRKWSAPRPGPYVQARTDWILRQIGYGPQPLPEPEPEPEPPAGEEHGIDAEPWPEESWPEESWPEESWPEEPQEEPLPAEPAAPAPDPAHEVTTEPLEPAGGNEQPEPPPATQPPPDAPDPTGTDEDSPAPAEPPPPP